jgi:hypothetical protein
MYIMNEAAPSPSAEAPGTIAGSVISEPSPAAIGQADTPSVVYNITELPALDTPSGNETIIDATFSDSGNSSPSGSTYREGPPTTSGFENPHASYDYATYGALGDIVMRMASRRIKRKPGDKSTETTEYLGLEVEPTLEEMERGLRKDVTYDMTQDFYAPPEAGQEVLTKEQRSGIAARLASTIRSLTPDKGVAELTRLETFVDGDTPQSESGWGDQFVYIAELQKSVKELLGGVPGDTVSAEMRAKIDKIDRFYDYSAVNSATATAPHYSKADFALAA